MHDSPLTSIESHFAFGDNWASYARLIDDAQIRHAEMGLRRLLVDEVRGRTFLDIGCGSGIHSLAALRLGAARVLALDLDPASVLTTSAVLAAHSAEGNYTAQVASVFELDPKVHGTFDIVYSWGVLHHTGDIKRAMRAASAMVAPDGYLALAIYQRTRLCRLWASEKRWYSRSGPKAQAAARGIYVLARRLSRWVRGRSFSKYVNTYGTKRGMDFKHDVHDWMGGYPYESLTPDAVTGLIAPLGFRAVRRFAAPSAPLGLFGAGCAEYVFQRNQR
jgi:2-polyprenyl-6-hydroxyphenyl methylase/3-demethylubiquinone-9 3-methyltransferase